MRITMQLYDYEYSAAFATRRGVQRHGVRFRLNAQGRVPQPKAARARMALRAWLRRQRR